MSEGTPLAHGSYSVYVHAKCRCDECREANRVYKRKFDRKSVNTPLRHGTLDGHRRGCRCAACTAAKSQSDREYYLGNREKVLARNRDWQRGNQEHVSATKAARHARIREANVDSDARLDEAELLGATKRCARCAEVLSVGDFYRNKNRSDGLMSRCRECTKAERAAHLATPRGQEVALANKIRKFGLTVADWDALLAAQGGRCAACRDVLAGSRRRPHVDHDHVTGRVRGILCHGCNTAEGLLKGDPEKAIRLAEYMQRHLDATSDGAS